MELTGKVIKVIRVDGLDTDDNKDWVRFDVLINHIQGEFPKNALLSFNGKKFTQVETLLDKTITAKFDINSKENKDKYRTRLDAFHYKVAE